MSHFAVLVIGGGSLEKKLAKFDENLDVKRYVLYTKEQLIAKGKADIESYKNSRYAEYLADPEKYAKDCNEDHLKYVRDEFPLKFKWTDEEIYAEELKWYEPEEIGSKGEVYSKRNPNAKWDWYQVGGRYRDRFKLLPNKSGTKGERQEKFVGSLYNASKGTEYADSAKKGNIDWAAIHQNPDAYNKALRFWDLKVNGATPLTKEEEEFLKWDWYKPEFYTERYKNAETYATAESNFTMWAYVKDGKWYEKGEMGWWGMSSESHDEAVKWELEFYDNVIKDLPDNTLLTVVDCHI